MVHLLNEFFVHYGILILPLLIYELWAFRKSFNKLPFAPPLIGLYGGMSAILLEMNPVHVFGIAEDFKCIPLILSFLFGKRRAGLISLAIAAVYRLHAGHLGAGLGVIAMVVYSIPPWLVSKWFDDFSTVTRLWVSIALNLAATAIQVGFVFLYFLVEVPGRGWHMLQPYLHTLFPAAIVQTLLIIPAFLTLELIVETGRVRRQLLESQKSLQESEQRYRSLVEYNPDAICAVDRLGKILFVNQAYMQLTGYTEAELVGADRRQMWFEQDHGLAVDIMAKLLAGDIMSNMELRIRHRDGASLPVRLTAVPLVVSAETTGFCAIVTDLRPIQMAEEVIRRADKLATVGELAAGVAHEIRNPLTALKGFLKLMNDHDPTTERYVAIMEQELDRLHLVSGQMLALAKPQVEKRSLVDLRDLTQDVLAMMEPQAIELNATLVGTAGVEPLLVEVDNNQIKQVLINIVKNAIEAAFDGGHITVATERRGREACIVVRDTGIGMPKEVIERLGEPFYTTKGSGTGLGLMVAHRIIESHLGEIHYASEENLGTTVTISLPAAEAPGGHSQQLRIVSEVSS